MEAQQFNLISSTHSACIHIEPIHSQLGRSNPSQAGNPTFAPSKNWSLCRRTSEDSSLTSYKLKPHLSMVDWSKVLFGVATIKRKGTTVWFTQNWIGQELSEQVRGYAQSSNDQEEDMTKLSIWNSDFVVNKQSWRTSSRTKVNQWWKCWSWLT